MFLAQGPGFRGNAKAVTIMMIPESQKKHVKEFLNFFRKHGLKASGAGRGLAPGDLGFPHSFCRI